MAYDDLIFRIHAIQRMFERDISELDVRDVLENGEVIETSPDDLPFPSFLMLGWSGGSGSSRRPIHVLASDDPIERATVVITVYEPDPLLWDFSFQHRR